MRKRKVVYFYFDTIIPCQKGRIKEVFDWGYEIVWLNDRNEPIGQSSVSKEYAFSSKKDCMNFSISLQNDKREKIKKSVGYREGLLSSTFS